MGKRKIVKPLRWRIGLPFDTMRRVADMKGIKLVKRTIVNGNEIEDHLRGNLIVRWFLSNGQKLTFEKTRLPNGSGELRYRITKVENRERNVKAKTNPSIKSTHG